MLYFTNIKPLEVLLPDLRRRKATAGSVRLSKYGIKVNPKTPRNHIYITTKKPSRSKFYRVWFLVISSQGCLLFPNHILSKNRSNSTSSYIKTSLGLLPSAGPTIPKDSNWSIIRPARLYPSFNLR